MHRLIKIKTGGVGGQGVQFFSKMLIQAVFAQGLNVSGTSWYEPASTGGLTISDVIIAPDEVDIHFPYIEEPDIMICFAQKAWDFMKDIVTKHTIVLADQINVQDFSGPERERARLAFHLPFFQKAIDMGSEKLGNIIVLGFLSEMLDIEDHYVPAILQDANPTDAEEKELLEVDAKYFQETLVKVSPEKFRENNINAYKKGYALSLSVDYEKETLLKQK